MFSLIIEGKQSSQILEFLIFLGGAHQTNSAAMMGTLSYMSPEQGLKTFLIFEAIFIQQVY